MTMKQKNILKKYQNGLDAYSDGNYQLTIQEMESILRQNWESPQLYYNLGNAYFREKVIRKFIEICNLHPVHGSYFREYSLDMRNFYTKCERDGYDWYRWEEVRKQCMSLEDMISALEDAGYRFKISEDNIIDFEDSPKFPLVKSREPIMKISKNNIKTETDRHPVLNGMLYDKDLKRRNALRAIEMIKEGATVKEAIKACQTSHSSICDFGYKRTHRQIGRAHV